MEKEKVILETVASCIVSMLTDTFTMTEAETILDMVNHEIHCVDEGI